MSVKALQIGEEMVLPRGFKGAGVVAGLKKTGKPDLALLYSETPAVVAGTFTTNQVKAATVKLCQKRLAGGVARAVVVNSGNANACTGSRGLADAEGMAALVAELLGLDARTVFVSSTGRIGVPLPMDVIERGIRLAVPALSTGGGHAAAEAIMTTDTRIKIVTARFAVDGKPVILSALAKGSGMIEPNMATMLAYLLTDAAVVPGALQEALAEAVKKSFNRISVDGDRSTNDTVLALANGQAGHKPLSPAHPDWPLFVEALQQLTLKLALKMVEDGEGATKLVTVRVKGARSAAEADLAARSVANSLLVKTSWVGDYPNWGRIMDALGYSEAKIVEEQVDIAYDGHPAAVRGLAAPTPLETLKAVQRQKAFTLDIDLHLGAGEATVYTCDCTEEYVRINF